MHLSYDPCVEIYNMLFVIQKIYILNMLIRKKLIFKN